MLSAGSTMTACARAYAPDARFSGLLAQANRADVKNAPLTPALARDGFAALAHAFAGAVMPLAQVRDATLASETGAPLFIRLYDPDPGQVLPVCLYLHGGGHMAGSIAVYDPVCRRLAAMARCRVVALEYRLAPEYPYPHGLDDCVRAVAGLPAWLHAHDIPIPAGLTLVGDSGGGALAASVCARMAGGATWSITRQVLIYPSLDYTLTTPAVVENASGYLLEVARVRWYFDQYFQHGEDRRAASPLFMPAAALPPTLLFTAGFCPLRDEGTAYAARLRGMGSPCMHWHLPGMIHAFMNLYAVVPDACDAVYREIGRFIRASD